MYVTKRIMYVTTTLQAVGVISGNIPYFLPTHGTQCISIEVQGL